MSRILYRAILGEEFDRLPPQIRDMHRFAARAKGTAGVSQGRSWAARLICRLTRLPRPASNVPVETSFEPLETGERWTRRFDGQPFQTDMLPGTRESFPCMLERLGPFLFKMRVTATAEGIDLTPEQVLLGPLRIPPALAPRPLGRERVVDGHYHFSVEVRFPLIGKVFGYQGTLQPSEFVAEAEPAADPSSLEAHQRLAPAAD
ncbi:DUF4166 domain-containing protein [Roseibium salinum]|uniref:DUF4166 domain-containing protein n=1 Tax=Roseibium salinum TaxID=1604349 RepID=A0ABT3R3M5_9HYPH|nr:DUF4166 domain-containing protein [Roseibium sp. DSM 29163]MCX2723799.1 DUF4166 domain-containing protein [Roseibium sp. DSM 29163]